ncbi:MAG TPA: hypothetical protein VGP93_01680 [Polyangiaceae bacterium]|jgi:hypothetical protein|nr:hypothetical protein [Polyangiaceae bacterium]
MDIAELVLQAVQNNSKWCDAIGRAHDAPGEFHDAYWINRGKVPPYTSKLITLAGAEHAETQLAAIRSLISAEPEAHFSVKDAFQSLDLAPLGFAVLFEAMWICGAPASPVPVDPGEQLKWSVVRDSDELAEWELAWRGSPANLAVDGMPRVFPPSLLEEPGLHFLAGKRGATTVASGALNRTFDVVGLSNVFSGMTGLGPLFPGCVRLARDLYPGIALVGYERGEGLLAAEKAGFAAVRALTVWKR